MPEHEVTQIMVGGHRIGIIDLKPALEEVANDFAGRPEAEIKAALMERLGRFELHRGKGPRRLRGGLLPRIPEARRRAPAG